jgi:hypothetical protein
MTELQGRWFPASSGQYKISQLADALRISPGRKPGGEVIAYHQSGFAFNRIG